MKGCHTLEYWLFAAGAGILVWTWLLVRKGYVSGWARLEESRQRLEAQATELAVVAEEVLSDLSERSERLRQLIAEADAIVAARSGAAVNSAVNSTANGAVGAAISAAPAPAPAANALAASPPAASPPAASVTAQAPPPTESEPVPPALALVAALEAAAASTSAPTERPSAPASGARVAASAPGERATKPAAPPSHQAVWDMAEQGADVTEIARRLQKTKGEVELILGLRRFG